MTVTPVKKTSLTMLSPGQVAYLTSSLFSMAKPFPGKSREPNLAIKLRNNTSSTRITWSAGRRSPSPGPAVPPRAPTAPRGPAQPALRGRCRSERQPRPPTGPAATPVPPRPVQRCARKQRVPAGEMSRNTDAGTHHGLHTHRKTRAEGGGLRGLAAPARAPPATAAAQSRAALPARARPVRWALRGAGAAAALWRPTAQVYSEAGTLTPAVHFLASQQTRQRLEIISVSFLSSVEKQIQ